MIEHSESIAKLADAMAKAQGEIKGAAKDSENPHFKSKYADLSSVWEACRAALSKNGIAVFQSPSGDEAGNVIVMTMLTHSSGEWMKDSLAVKPGKADAQGVGSVITYLRRYALAAMVGVAPEDDDAESGVGRGKSGGGEMQTAKAPAGKQGEPAHKAWIRKALGELLTMRSQAEMDGWERDNQPALQKLQNVAQKDYDDFMAEMTRMYQKLPSTLEAA